MKYIIMIMSALLILSCNQKVIKQEVKQDEVLATWRGGQVTLNEFEDFKYNYIYKSDSVSFYEDSLKNELAYLIKAKIVLSMIDSLKLDTVKSLNDFYSNNFDYISVQKLRDDSIRNKVINNGMVKNIYEKKKYKYRISHILFSKDSQHEITIDSVYSLIIKNNLLFDSLAIKFSDDKPTAKNAGDLGWFKFDEMPAEEFKHAVAPELKNKILKPFVTKYGKHILNISDVKEDDKDQKSFIEERINIIKYLEKKYEKELDNALYDFTDKLFKKYNISIDSIAIDKAVDIYNNYNGKGLYADSFIKSIENQIIISKLGSFSFTLGVLRSYLRDYLIQNKIIDRHEVIKANHAMYRRILLAKFVKELNYTRESEIIYRTKLLTVNNYVKYLIYNYFVPELVQKLENNEINEFPSLKEINLLWHKSLFEKYNVVINDGVFKR